VEKKESWVGLTKGVEAAAAGGAGFGSVFFLLLTFSRRGQLSVPERAKDFCWLDTCWHTFSMKWKNIRPASHHRKVSLFTFFSWKEEGNVLSKRNGNVITKRRKHEGKGGMGDKCGRIMGFGTQPTSSSSSNKFIRHPSRLFSWLTRGREEFAQRQKKGRRRHQAETKQQSGQKLCCWMPTDTDELKRCEPRVSFVFFEHGSYLKFFDVE
jgi:hypothetical protein